MWTLLCKNTDNIVMCKNKENAICYIAKNRASVHFETCLGQGEDCRFPQFPDGTVTDYNKSYCIHISIQ